MGQPARSANRRCNVVECPDHQSVRHRLITLRLHAVAYAQIDVFTPAQLAFERLIQQAESRGRAFGPYNESLPGFVTRICEQALL